MMNLQTEIYVVSMHDVECDYPKNTNHIIYAVLTNEKEADKLCNKIENDYGEHEYDARCQEFRVTTLLLNPLKNMFISGYYVDLKIENII